MRSDRARLEDILEMCRNLSEHVAGRADALASDPVLLAATQRWIEIIGEAAASLSDELRDAHPAAPWRGAIGMRNILAHGYFHVDIDLIRRVVEHDAPSIERDVARILGELR